MIQKLLLTFLSGILLMSGLCAAAANRAITAPAFSLFTEGVEYKAAETKKQARAEKRIQKVMGKLGSRDKGSTLGILLLCMLLVTAAGIVGMIAGAIMGNFPVVLWSFAAFFIGALLAGIAFIAMLAVTPIC